VGGFAGAAAFFFVAFFFAGMDCSPFSRLWDNLPNAKIIGKEEFLASKNRCF
jgi:hypothetical protein